MLDLEAFVYGEMVKKLEDFKTLTVRRKASKVNPKLTAKQLELAKIEREIEKRVEIIATAGATLVSYVNAKVEELDMRRQSITKEIATLTIDTIPSEQVNTISDQLDDWKNVSFEDKQKVMDSLITRVRATNESVEIEWKI